jgi:hypothetical protein
MMNKDRERMERGDCSPGGCPKRRSGSGTDGDEAAVDELREKTAAAVKISSSPWRPLLREVDQDEDGGAAD